MTEKAKVLYPFNGPIECGLRLLVILEASYPLEYDLQRLVFYDYLLVHSGDANGPQSIHPPTPHRSGEVLVKRQILEQGLLLMISRSLIQKKYTSSGILYHATEYATSFLDSLSSTYTLLLKDRANWLIDQFKDYTDTQLEKYFHTNLDRWGGEFEREAILKYGEI